MIDGLVFIGRNPSNGLSLGADALISHLQNQSAARVFAASYKSIFLDCFTGNAEVIELHNKYPELIEPVAVIVPHNFNVNNGTDYLTDLKSNGVNIIGFYKIPKYYDLYFESPLLQELVRLAVETGFIIQFGIENLSDLHTIINLYSGLSGSFLIRWMNGRGVDNISEIINIMQTKGNIFFDAGSINTTGGIKFVVENTNSNQLFYSSGIPENFSHTSYTLVQYADLIEQDLTNIYHNTLAKLLGRPLNAPNKGHWKVSKKSDSVISLPKIDIHWHSGGWNMLNTGQDNNLMIKTFDELNYELAIISSTTSLNGCITEGNSELDELLSTLNDPRMYGYIVINPLRPEESIENVKKYCSHRKFVGLKTIQDLYGLRLDDEPYTFLFSQLRTYNLPILAHIPGMLEAAQSFPDMTFVCAHSTYARVKHMFGQKNIFFELATSQNDIHETNPESFLQSAGTDKILFGSDGQLISPYWTLGKLMQFSDNDETLKSILHNNALTAFPKLAYKGD